MSGIDSKKTASGSRMQHGVLHGIRHHFLHNWAGALLVTSLIALAKYNSNWLATFDGYTFMLVGNFVAVFEAQFFDHHQEAVVVMIDQQTYETRYKDRSPLNRCELAKDLRAVYAAEPSTLAIDLDISPAVWLAEQGPLLTKNCPEKPQEISDQEFRCQQQLYDLIRCAKKTRTILVEPPPSEVNTHQTINAFWRKEMVAGTDNPVSFGNTALNETFGMLLTYPTDSLFLPNLARSLACADDKDSNPTCANHAAVSHDKKQPYIDSRAFGFELLYMPLNLYSNEESFSSSLEKYLDTITDHYGIHAGTVFFGGAYGYDDIFITSLGIAYGVESLAGIYVSSKIGERHDWGFIIDFAISILFGTLISRHWREFYQRRSDENPHVRQTALVPLLRLAGVSFAVIFIAVLGSALAFLECGVWFSPVPIFIGMAVETWVSGSIDQALAKLRLGITPKSQSAWELFLRPVGLGFFRLYKKRQRKIAYFILAFEIVCAAIIVCAIWKDFFAHQY